MIKLIIKYSLQAAVLWTLIIFVLCCTPGQYIPTTNWLELLSFDKFVHLSIFFGLVFLWSLAINQIKTRTKSLKYTILISAIIYGGLLEIMQATVFSHRSGDWFDFMANTTGCILAWWFFDRINKNIEKFKT